MCNIIEDLLKVKLGLFWIVIGRNYRYIVLLVVMLLRGCYSLNLGGLLILYLEMEIIYWL